MAFSRYINLIGPVRNTTSMSLANSVIRRSVINNTIESNTIILEEDRRLDQLSGQIYGDASYWWILAAASGIGWGLQVPAGTVILAPRDLGKVLSLII